MKIAILTQPLNHNYGGLLQAFAIQKALKKYFNYSDVTTIDIYYGHSKFSEIKMFIKKVLKVVFFGYKKLRKNNLTEEDFQKVIINMTAFKNKYISLSSKRYTKANIRLLKNLNFDAYIVGSDQVWRPKYSPNILSFFLDFVGDKTSKKISYAASFGVDSLEYKKRLLKKCSKFLNDFDAISVREKGAINLCKNSFNVNDVKLVLDPTLLLEIDDYKNILNKENLISTKQIMYYVLDEEFSKPEVEYEISNFLNMPLKKIMPQSFVKEKDLKISDKHIYPPVEEWLEGFISSEFIVTDSFHGTIFSILFNKQFITVGNKERGMSRFESIISLFGLEDRLVLNKKDLKKTLNKKINYDLVNTKLEKWREHSLLFLKNSLNNES